MLAKKIVLGVGIAIVFPMMIHYGVCIFSPKPKWEDYRIADYYIKHKNASPKEKKKLQAEQKRLVKQRKEATRRFQSHLFYVAVPLGIIAIIIGSLLSIHALGAGLMLGGIFSASNGYFNYWNVLDDWLKFLSAFCVFVVLVGVAYRKIEKKKAE